MTRHKERKGQKHKAAEGQRDIRKGLFRFVPLQLCPFVPLYVGFSRQRSTSDGELREVGNL
jgi:hypothetical protein